jgi:hypothetical protein
MVLCCLMIRTIMSTTEATYIDILDLVDLSSGGEVMIAAGNPIVASCNLNISILQTYL